MFGFKGQVLSLQGVNAADDFKLKPMLTDHPENPRALKNSAKSTLPRLYKLNNKACIIVHLFTTQFTYFKPTLEIYCSERFRSKYDCSLTKYLDTQSSDGGVQ